MKRSLENMMKGRGIETMKILVTDVTEQSYTKEVSESDCPVIAFFSSQWNRGLDTTYLVFRTLAEKYGKEVKFVNIDSEKCLGIASRYRATDQLLRYLTVLDNKASLNLLPILRCYTINYAVKNGYLSLASP